MASSQQLILGEGAGGAAPPAPQYQISRSLRFNAPDSSYLDRTPSSTTNRRTYTFSCWAKLCYLPQSAGEWYTFLSAGIYDTATASVVIQVVTEGTLRIGLFNNSSYTGYYFTSTVCRDLSAWYHFVFVVDTTQSTDSNRLKIYINNRLDTGGSASWPAQNLDTGINLNQIHYLGAAKYYNAGSIESFAKMYMTEMYFIDGQALTPSSFGETNSATGVWQPKAYTGTYGTNGFYLNFSDNSGTTSTTLGKDYSGNGNNWTPNNFSVTAGVNNDSFVDTPTPYGTDTGAGGEVRGNYATWNRLVYPNTNVGSGFFLENGNLQAGNGTDLYFSVYSTIAPKTGKWYVEKVSTTQVSWNTLGISRLSNFSDYASYASVFSPYLLAAGIWSTNSGSNATDFSANDIISMAVDLDNRAVWFAKNGSWIDGNGSESSSTVKSQIESGNTSSAAFTWANTVDDIVIYSRDRWALAYINFGQRAFSYTAPSGFKALCTQNLPTPTIGATSATQAQKYFDTTLYTGNGSAGRVITTNLNEVGLAWVKIRSGADDHRLANIVTGGNKHLKSNTTEAESASTNVIQAFSGATFTVGSDNSVNANTSTYVAWSWAGNGAGSTNNAGSIQSTVSANTTAGFSIVTYTGTGSNATVGHGLGVAPSMIITKNRSTTSQWAVYHSRLTSANYALLLNLTNAEDFSSAYWNSTAPTSTLFSVGGAGSTSGSGNNMVAYCFAPVEGYSAFGSYTGNGADDGPFNYLGFRAAWILVKRSSSAGEGWWIYDNKRSPYNIANVILSPDSSGAEISGGTYPIDINSNGFKIRGLNALLNTNGATYIYAAFAEFPFKYTLAR